jgi:pyruvate dehydrogenase E2 component (dihydrolipoamide acetyltransferase)
MTELTFNLPDLGEGLQGAEIVSWHVAEGDHVVADQPLVSVETEKAVVEVPSPRAGRIAKLFGGPGESVAVGAPLVAFADGEHKDAGGIVGDLVPEDEQREDEQPEAAPAPAAARPASKTDKVKALPAVRARARELGVDLAAVTPSGKGGEVTKHDVEQAAGGGAVNATQGPALEPLKGVRRAMAEAMTRAHDEVARATVTDEVDVEAWAKGTNVTVRLLQAIAAGCKAEPNLNVWYDAKAGGRRLMPSVDVGIAVDTKDGLFVPVVKDVAGKSADTLAADIERYKKLAETREIPLDEMRGATISLSNFGTLGGRFANLVVVPPQVAILGAGSIVPRVVARQGAPAVRRMLPLSLTFDHRVVSGGEAARFLAAVKTSLEASNAALLPKHGKSSAGAR